MSSEPWTCSACTYVHEEPTEVTLKQCAMCGTPRAAAARHEPDAAAASEEEDNNDDSEEEEYEDDEDDAFDACDAFDEPSAPSASDEADRAEKRKRLEQEHAFEKQESALAKQFAGEGSAQATRLLAKEYMRFVRLQSRGENEGVEVSMPDESNAYRWAVAVTPPTDVPLFGELARFAAKYNAPAAIQMELLFSPAFPMEPPFVRVVRPRLAFHTGHVTVGGSICIELLTSSGWSPAYTLESLLVQLRSLFVAGEARLDPAQPDRAYGEQEARDAFRRVAMQHGWKV